MASKVGNLRSKLGHARPLGSRIIGYVRDGRTDGHKQRLLPPSLRAGHNKRLLLLGKCIYKRLFIMIKLLLIAIHSSWFKMFCFIETEIITLKDPIFLEVWTVGQ